MDTNIVWKTKRAREGVGPGALSLTRALVLLFCVLLPLQGDGALFVMSDVTWDCAANCVECFGAASTQCLKCASGYSLQTYSCVLGTTCPSGYLLDAHDNICKRTIYANDWPCPHGTYSGAQQMFELQRDCAACTLGRYCPARGQQQPTGSCAAGFYCKSGSSFQKPLRDLSTWIDYVNTTYTSTDIGHYCEAGSYCPTQATAPIACDAGFYCPQAMMAGLNTTKTCQAGYYCSGGASTPSPTDNSTGNICSPGHYCLAGATSGTKCPIGTYCPAEGATSLSQCLSCSPGQYCAAAGLAAPSGNCSAGCYCPGGQSEATPLTYRCPLGYECAAGSVSPKKCETGKYTPTSGASSCTQCPVGSYCSEKSALTTCEPGYYCPGNDTRISCPLGTFNQATNSSSISACTNCAAGKACTAWGAAGATSSCGGGFVCPAGSTTPTPLATAAAAGMCAPGAYCPTGSASATACPAGSYCKDYAASTYGGLCEAGYYCTAGSTKQNPQNCTAGHYCPAGASAPTPCPAGTYSYSLGASSISHCQACPAGYTCLTSGLVHYDSGNPSSTSTCPAGYYCESGTGTNDTTGS